MSKSIVRSITLLIIAVMMLGGLAACSESSSNESSSGGVPGSNKAPESTATSASVSSPSASGSPAASGASGGTINVGVILPLTGPNADTGKDTLNGIKLAVEQANASGELPGTIKITSDDDRSTPSEGVSAVQKQINQDKVSVILGAFNSSVTLAIRDVTHDAEIPQLTLGAAADSITQDEKGQFVWRAHMYNHLQADQFANYIVDSFGAKKVAVLVENTDYGAGLRDAWVPFFDDAGTSIVAKETYNPADTDFLGVLTKIKNANPDYVVLEALATSAGIILKQAQGLGMDMSKFVGIGGLDQTQLPELAAGAQNGVNFMLWFSPEANDQAKTFAEAYQKKYNEEPNSFAAQGYTVGTTLVEAIKLAGSGDSAKLQAALPSVEFDSPIGHIKFDEHHNATASIFMAKWQDDQKVLLEKQPQQPQ